MCVCVCYTQRKTGLIQISAWPGIWNILECVDFLLVMLGIWLFFDCIQMTIYVGHTDSHGFLISKNSGAIFVKEINSDLYYTERHFYDSRRTHICKDIQLLFLLASKKKKITVFFK